MHHILDAFGGIGRSRHMQHSSDRARLHWAHVRALILRPSGWVSSVSRLVEGKDILVMSVQSPCWVSFRGRFCYGAPRITLRLCFTTSIVIARILCITFGRGRNSFLYQETATCGFFEITSLRSSLASLFLSLYYDLLVPYFFCERIILSLL